MALNWQFFAEPVMIIMFGNAPNTTPPCGLISFRRVDDRTPIRVLRREQRAGINLSHWVPIEKPFESSSGKGKGIV